MVIINHKKLCENCFAETDRSPCPVCGFDKNRYVRDQMTLTIGSILESRYVIGGVIGKGGFGTTYLAYDRKLECRVAVKEYYPYGLAVRSPGTTTVSVSNAEAEETFKNGAEKFYDEARLVAKFNGNPNIVSVHDFFYENDTVYFTMGYLEGQTLKAFLKEHGALSPGQAVCVAEAVSNALMAAHSLNVLHRDISPDNIMVCKDGTIKLLDFGAARQVVTEGSQSLSVILKQGFAPLEQYQKKGKQGPWTDIYSLGATLYHALTLDVLDDPMSRLEEDEEYSSNKHHIADELWQVIKKATALKIQDRYQDIFEWKKDLNNLSIKAVPLVEKEISEEKVKFGSTAKALGDTVHIVSGTGTAEEEDAVGVTMPLQEEDTVGVTMPLREEEAVGMTVPLQEEETVGMTMPLQEEEIVGMTVPLQEKETSETSSQQTEEKTVQEAGTLQETEKHDSDQQEVGEEKPERKQQSRKKKWIVGAAVLAVAVVLVFAVGRKFIFRNVIMVDHKADRVFGNSQLNRSSIEKISFLDTKREVPNNAWDVSKVHNGTVMAWTDKADSHHLYIAAEGKIVVKSANNLFAVYRNLEEIEFMDCLDTSHTTDMYAMFRACNSLSNIDVSGFDTSQVTSMSDMFRDCSSLSNIDVSGFDTSQVTSMGGMFSGCSSLSNIDVSGFDTSQVTIMYDMFAGAGITAEEAGFPQ